MVVWQTLTGFLLVGYLCMTRSFAYLGVPPLFIGEIVLAAFVLLKPRVILGTWAFSLLRPSPMNTLGIAMLVFVLYGVWQVGRGVAAGSSVLYTLKYFIFNYYTIYLFIGIWIGLQSPDFLRKVVRAIAWVNGIYGLSWILALKHVAITMPASNVPVFGQPIGSAVAILGLLCFERDFRAIWPIIALNLTVMLAMQWRTEWLGFSLGLLVWGLLTGRIGRVVAMGLAGLAVLGMIELAGIQLVGRTGSAVSLGETLGRMIAPIDADLAKELSPDAQKHAHTATWRERWWDEIWLSVHSTPMLEAFGHGYGFDLVSLAPEDVRAGQPEMRTPHSVFFYALGYTGWVGVGLFVVLQLSILRLLWRTFRFTGEPAGLVFAVTIVTMSFFEAGFDTPYRAIPFYLLAGMGIAPGFRPQLAPADAGLHQQPPRRGARFGEVIRPSTRAMASRSR